MRHEDNPVPEQPRPVPAGPLYFVGVGGAGMSALAQILAERGQRISGADPGISPVVRARLEKAGITVYTQHEAVQVGDAVAVIVSDAIPAANPEVQSARERDLPIIRRPELLGAIVNAGRGIAIAGTHGKTTTTGMVASILLAADMDPTIILGGDLPAIGGNARNGKSDLVLAESCEAYDGFLYLHPEIAVVLNVEADHLDYHGTEQHVFDSFERFLTQLKPGGTAIICGDDENACKVGGEADEILVARPEGGGMGFYSVKPGAPYYAANINVSGPSPTFDLQFFTSQNDKTTISSYVSQGIITLKVPGLHNVSNALAAASVGFTLGIPSEKIIEGLEAFTGTGRRFERIGELSGVVIIDDYAHHPTELRATLSAARNAFPDKRIVAVFQPHLPSRTRDNMDEFADALTLADVVFLTDIYLAREQPLEGITSEILATRTRDRKPGLSVTYVADKGDLPAALAKSVQEGDIVLTLGAGDIRVAGEKLLGKLKATK